MGGGRSTTSAMYGIHRKQQIAKGIIERTLKKYGVDVDIGYIPIRVINAKNWSKYIDDEHAAAFFRESSFGRVIYVKREYFAGRAETSTLTHEIIHSLSGPHLYEGFGSALEEGTVEYISRGGKVFGVRGRSADYARGMEAYPQEVGVVSKLIQIVGRKKFINYWHKGFRTEHKKLASDLEAKGYTRTGSLIRKEYYVFGANRDREESAIKINMAMFEDWSKRQDDIVFPKGVYPYEEED